MEKSGKNLKNMSIAVLVLAGISLVRLIVTFIVTQLHIEEYLLVEATEDVTEEEFKIGLIVILVLGLICLIPQIYVGFKGLKMAKNPDSSKAHIVWAIILLVLSIIAIISPVLDIIDGKNITDNVIAACDAWIDIIVFIWFIKYAKEVRAAAR